MKPEKWDDVHSAVQQRDAEGLRRIATAASREETRILLNLLAEMISHDHRKPGYPPRRENALARSLRRAG